ncbi:MAG: amidase [Nocardioidaceae bacterium]
MSLQLSSTEQDRIAALDATGQAALVRAGEVGADDLVETAIARIERLDPGLNAVVIKAFDQAREAVGRGLPDGPFAGVPFLLKDLAIEAAGLPFTEGSRFLAGNVSTVDSETVVRLRRAGLVVLGKTNTPEFGMKPTAEPWLFGPTRNPWDTARTTGGSSGGSAAAVAAGMVPMAHGNDAGGSLRIPASACGLFGLKPTRARTTLAPLYGDAFGGWAIEHALTRSVRDSAALLDAIGGPAPGDPYAAPPSRAPYAEEVGRTPGPLRIAVTRTPASAQSVDRECLAALDDAVGLLEELGHRVFERDLTELDEAVGEAIGTVYDSATVWIVRYWSRLLGREPREDELEPFTWALYQEGLRITGGDYLLAVTDLQAFSRRVAAAFAGRRVAGRLSAGFDLWLSPTLATLPPAIGVLASKAGDPWAGNAEAGAMLGFPLVVANVTGNPAMSVPLSWTEAGLPVGVHLMAAYGDEATLFRLAGQLEAARPWADRRPPVW